MFSVRRIIGDDWGSTSRSKWVRERASLEIDYTAYGLPDAIVGLLTDPWVDLAYDGVSTFADYQAFLNLFSAQDPRADRNADTVFNFYDVQFYLADQSAAGADLTPTGRLNEEENPFGLDGYRYDAITGLYHVRHRVLDPEQGRWMQRDPAGFVDGGNVYTFAVGLPGTLLDPAGAWVIWRHKWYQYGEATSEPGDTIEDLAKEIDLDPEEYYLWLKPIVWQSPDFDHQSPSPDKILCTENKVRIPNTVYVFIIDTKGNINRHGRFPDDITDAIWKDANHWAASLDRQGYHTLVRQKDLDTLYQWIGMDDIAGVGLFGHGGEGYFSVPSRGSYFSIVAPIDLRSHLHHRLAFAMLYYCQGGWKANDWYRYLMSPTGVVFGTSDSFAPGWFHDYTDMPALSR